MSDLTKLKSLYEQPPSQPTKVSAQLRAPGGRRYWVPVEVIADPGQPDRRLFFLYDVSEVYDLRRLLTQQMRFHGLVGETPAMHLVYQKIQDVAPSDTTVLIQGETGTGKELVARAIHFAEPRKNNPFVAINCAGLSPELIESRLFGHKRGSFTGAGADQIGFFEAANGGTLFLDEIGDIPLSVPPSLLRVLQEHEIIRLGESLPRKINVRVIVASNRDLDRAVAAGRFRRDLLYRIRVTRIQLPLLRERREDILPLVSSFLDEKWATTTEQALRRRMLGR